MAVEKHYDALIVGSGEAGKYLAWHLSRQGSKTVVVERSLIGGACPNVACLPSKNIIHSAKVIDEVRHAKLFGAEVASGWRVDASTVRDRKRAMVAKLIQIHLDRFKANGTELLMGEARFVSDRTVSVALFEGGERIIRAERVFLNTGTSASKPDVPGLMEARPLTHVEALELDVIPEHLIVLGGGFVGIEFAQAYRRFGSEVTLIQRNKHLLPGEDNDVSEAVLQMLLDEGVSVLLGASPDRIEGVSGEAVIVHLAGDEPNNVRGSHLMIATGRTPNTSALNLPAAGIKTDAFGFIAVNERLETSAPNVWAMGDCAGSPMFTHVSYDDFRVVKNQLEGGNKTTAGRLIPSTLFTDPELAHVGLREHEMLKAGTPYRIAKLPMAAVLRTKATGEERGFLKAFVGDNDRILGFTAFGANAGETLATVQTAMLGGMSYTELADAIFTHPTLAEGLVYLFSAMEPKV